LNDFYLTFSLVPKENKFSSSIDIHYFTSNTSLENSAGEEKTIFGQEIDFTIKYNFIKGTTIIWGGSVFIPGELMRLIFQPANDVGFWSYVMITANI